MIIIGPLTYNFNEEIWECDGSAYPGQLCHTGLQAALDTELETNHTYELRIYPKRPRGDVSELTLSYGKYEYDSEEIEDEYGEVHELDWQLADIVRKKFGKWKKDNKIIFYVRPLDLGPAPKVVEDWDFDNDESKLHITAEDGSTATFKIDLENAKWS